MLNLEQVIKEVEGELIGENVNFSSVSIDTRTLEPDALFIAIDGENYKGIDLIHDAKEAGAAAVMYDGEIPDILPGIKVDNSIKALGEVAGFWRNYFDIPVIGVTGSNGKTTTKEMIASILALQGDVHFNPGNFNNHIGVPLTLLGLRHHHQFAVVEMGMNHPGEIAYLSKMARPSIALLLNVGTAHLEGLGTLAGVARAKAEILQGVSDSGSVIINADDRFVNYWLGRSKKLKNFTFGMNKNADVNGSVKMESGRQIVRVELPNEYLDIKLNLIGNHNAANAVAAATAAWVCGVGSDTIRAGLESIKAQPGRLETLPGPFNSSVIDDSYNCNPESLKAAIKTISSFSGPKVLILGDMAELGDGSERFHSEAGRQALEAGIDHLFTFGSLASHAAKSFGENAKHCSSFDDLISQTKGIISSDLTILVKGSRSARMEQVVNVLIGLSDEGVIAC